jgi:hypothetical protein
VNRNERLKSAVLCTFVSAVYYYDMAQDAGYDKSFPLLSEEFLVVLELIDTLFDEHGGSKDAYTYGMVKQSIEGYHNELRPHYPMMAYQVRLVLDKLYDLEDVFLCPVREGGHPIPSQPA